MDGLDNKVPQVQTETLLSVGLLGVLLVLLVPMPPVVLDMLLAANLAFSVLLMLITLGVKQPLELSVFPSLLLLMTLARLSLNVATTRLILLNADAGKIVSTFGGVVVGGNLVVGLVIFLILVIIQFIVITKGAGRVSEVAARFTLDAMPGKQMAIDAELGAGTINEDDARARRDQLSQEAEFYGAMDGAGKFVRGDAIAGLVITAINLIGGVIIGMTGGLSISEAIRQFSILTIGDGLVSQIPALVIATTAGILVTKAASKISLGNEIGLQVLMNRRPLMLGAVILVAISLMPGLPRFPFLFLAGVLAFAWYRHEEEPESSPDQTEEEPPAAASTQIYDEFLQHDRACLEIGVRLIPLVDSKRRTGLVERIGTLRLELARKHGIWIPAVRIRDNIHLGPDAYRILINGREIAAAQIRVDALMAIDPGGTQGELDGEEARDPAFDLPAKWIPQHMKPRAELKGYTVVDSATVVITHLGEVLRRYAHELLSREDLRKLLDKVKETSPSIVDELKPDLIRMGELHEVLVLLLEERVPVTNLTRILETITQFAHKIKQPTELADCVRRQLGRDILERHRGQDGKVRTLVLDPRLESQLREFLRERNLSLPPEPLERLLGKLNEHWQKSTLEGTEAVLLADGELRRPLRQAISRALPEFAVVAYHEIPNDTVVEFQQMLKLEDIFKDDANSVVTNPPEEAANSAA